VVAGVKWVDGTVLDAVWKVEWQDGSTHESDGRLLIGLEACGERGSINQVYLVSGLLFSTETALGLWRTKW
jgi:hypothetical protein